MSEKKFTTASFKAWIKKNKNSLYVKVTSSFDGMTDGIERVENPTLRKIESEKIDFDDIHELGINGLRLVGGGRDYFKLNGNKVEVLNCCGSCTLITI